MAVGNAVLDVVLEDGFLEQVVRTGERFRGRLEGVAKSHSGVVKGLRGRGLMIGLECVAPAGDLVAKLRAEGLLTVPAAENVVRLLPPLTISESEVDEAMAILERVIAAWPKAA
jgi:acetylornithine/N-succinyldiaminopimelate aminotransferase